MPNIIDSIQISSSTFDVRDKSATTVVNLTQEQYDNLPSSAKTANVLYNITDATAGDLSQYWTSAQTQSAITEAISGKVETSAITSAVTSASTDNEIPTAKAVFDAIPTGGTGGGKAIEAGRGISVTTGETADTVSLNLAISAGTGLNSIIVGSNFNEASGAYAVAQGEWTKASGGTSHTEGSRTKTYGIYSHAEGSYSEASGGYSHAEGDSTYATAQASHSEGQGTSATSMASHSEGRYTQANGMGSHSEGYYTIAENEYEHASGKFNASNTGESTSAQTLFSVGNGGWDETLQENVRHNAFEIRKNGDIYLSSGGTDIKLQDYLGGGGGGITSGEVQTMIDESISGKADTDSLSAYTINEGVASSSQTYVVETPNPYGSQPSIVNTLDNSYEGLRVYKVNNYSTCYLIGYDENDAEIGRIYFSPENPTAIDTTGFTDVIINNERISDSASTAIVEGKELTAIKKFSFYNNYWATDEETSVYFYNKAYNVTDAVRFDFAKKADGISVSQVFGSNYVIIGLNSGEKNVASADIAFDSTYFKNVVDQYDNVKMSINDNGFQDYAKTSAVTAAIDAAVSGRVATSAITSAVTSASTDSEIPTAKAVYDSIPTTTSAVTSGSTDVLTSGGAYEQFGGLKIVKLTESQYTALITKDESTLYVVIPDPTNP